MTDVSIFETINLKPTIIQTSRNEIVVIRGLPAPGPSGPSGVSILTIDGGSPSSDYANMPLIDGGTP